VAGLPFGVTEDSRGDWHRNIVSLRKTAGLFDELVDDPSEAAVLVQHEIATKQTTRTMPIIHRPFEDVAVYDPIRSVIAWPFENPLVSRYSDGTFGVWYGADSIETSVHETVYHFRLNTLASEVAAKSSRPIIQHRRVHRVRCAAMLVDLRPHCATDRRILDPVDYSYSHSIGARLRAASLPGLLAPSARFAAGLIAAVFASDALSDPREVCYLTYTLDAQSKRVEVERAPGTIEYRLDAQEPVGG